MQVKERKQIHNIVGGVGIILGIVGVNVDVG